MRKALKQNATGIYQYANWSLDPRLPRAQSYHWWTFLRVIDGAVVFNAHAYSATTQRHQYHVRGLLSDHGIEIDWVIRTVRSLDHPEAIQDAIERLQGEAEELIKATERRGTKKAKNAERTEQAAALLNQALALKTRFIDSGINTKCIDKNTA